MSKEKLIILLKTMNIENYEITDKNYGVNLLTNTPLKKVYVDRFILDPVAFKECGYGPVMMKRGSYNGVF